MSLNLAQLRAFVAVVDEGGFGAAAETLGISQSAVSHAVAALERTLGVPVLRRAGGTSPLTPTAAGGRILGPARTAVTAAGTIENLAAEHTGRPTGTVRLAAPPSVCQGLLPGLLDRWAAELPGLRVRVFEGEDDEVTEWLAGGTVETAVLVDPPPAADGTASVVGEDEFHALVRRDHPLAAEPAISVADLADDPFLVSAGGCESHVRRLHRRAGVPLRPAHRVREMGTLLAMVRHGVGVSVVPGLTAAMLTDERLVLVPLRERVTRRLVLSGPPDRPCPPTVAALLAAARPAD